MTASQNYPNDTSANDNHFKDLIMKNAGEFQCELNTKEIVFTYKIRFKILKESIERVVDWFRNPKIS